MNQLQVISKNGRLLVDSRDVAEMTGKKHFHLVRDIQNYIAVLGKSNFGLTDFFIESYYNDAQGKPRLHFYLTKKGCDMVANKMTGEKGVLFTATYVSKFEEMENKLKSITTPSYMIEDPIKRAEKWIEEQQEKQLLVSEIEENKPKVIFADAVTSSKSSILVGELAKILKQNGINIGQNRLFNWLRDNGYLIKRKGTDYNIPTQRSMELGLFEIKETNVTHSDGRISVSKTPKVTGKGQVYFINKFKRSEQAS